MARPLALITGASSGIGEELARQYVGDGYDVILVARSAEKLEAVAAALTAKGASATCIPCDLSVPNAATGVFEAVGDRPVDVLINNAGVGTFGAFVDVDVTEQVNLIRLNIEALTHLSGLFLPKMIARGSGHVMQVGSTAGFQPGPLMATYYASKAFVVSFTEALAVELEGTGVTTSVLCPGPVVTGFQAAAKMENSKLLELGITPVEDVAKAGRQAQKSGRTIAIVGWRNRLLVFLSTRFAPRWLTPRIVKRIQSSR